MSENLCQGCQYKSPAESVLNDEELDQLNSSCARVYFKSGEMIVKQNALSTNVVYIKTGLVKIHVSDGEKEKIIRIMKAPAYLCLPSNFSDRINHFSASAIEDTLVCFFDFQTFKDFIYSNGEFAYQIIMGMSESQLQNLHEFINSNQKNTMGKVAGILVFFFKDIYDNRMFNLPINRQELADMAGTTRESVSRMLSEFDNEGIIKLKGKQIEVLNEKRLLQISQNG